VKTTGAQLSLTDVCQLCLAFGTPANAAVAAAVVLGGSGGYEAAKVSFTDPRTGKVSYRRGLWQYSAAMIEVSDLVAYDAAAATSYAFHASAGFVTFSGFAGWDSGAYKRYLPQTRGQVPALLELPNPWVSAVSAVGGVLDGAGGAVIAAAGGGLTGIEAVGSFATKLGQQGTWMRVVYVVGGLAAVVFGALLLERGTIGAAASAAADFVPAGKVIKAAATVAGPHHAPKGVI
jgi:uncharacterized membrane protein YuzA (DUF378 family)